MTFREDSNNILDDENYTRGTLTLEETSSYKDIFKVLKFLHALLSLALLIAGLIWVYAIILKYLQFSDLFNHQMINEAFDALMTKDRNILIGSLFIQIYGAGLWLILFVLNLIFRMYKLSRTSLVIGIVGIILDGTIIMSPQFNWVLD